MSKQFEPFLKGMKRARTGESTVYAPHGEGQPNHIGSASTVLGVLASEGPRSLGELQEATGLGFNEFADAIKALLEAGLIELDGPSGEEVARLSETGSALAAPAA